MPAYVASGTYGCVFKPHLACNAKKNIITKSKKTIGKIFSDENEARNELSIHHYIFDSVDPHGDFTVQLFDKCTVSKFKNNDGHERCSFIDDQSSPLFNKTQSYMQLIYEYGGISIDHYLHNNKPSIGKVKALLKSFVALFEGVAKMHQHGFVHQDIKPANILYLPKKKKAKLIDMGLVTKLNKVYTKSNAHVLIHPYPYYPPEFKLQYSKNFIEYVNLVNRNFASEHYIPIKAFLEDASIDFNESIKSSFILKNQDTAKIDSYSLGIVLAKIMVWSEIGDKNASPSKRKTKSYNILQGIKAVIKALCDQDSTKRINVYEAVNVYKYFVTHYI